MSIHKKLCAVAKQVGHIQFNAHNDFHDYDYTSAAAVLMNARAALAEAGISTQSRSKIIKSELIQAKDKRGKDILVSKVIIKTTYVLTDAETGERAKWEGHGEGLDNQDKATMKAQTAANKYAIATGLMASWDKHPRELPPDPEADPDTDQTTLVPGNAGVDKPSPDPWSEEKFSALWSLLEKCGSTEAVDRVKRRVDAGEPLPADRARAYSLINTRKAQVGGGNGNGK